MVPEALEGVYRGFELVEMSKCRGIEFVPERSVTRYQSETEGLSLRRTVPDGARGPRRRLPRV
jgi:hypothetical protein